MKAKVMIVCLCLVIQDNGRSRVVGITRNGGSMWLFLLAIGLWHEYETERGN
jgi:hypothetical protein